MKDIDKLQKLFDEFGIGYVNETLNDGSITVTLTPSYSHEKGKVGGYWGFYARFEFKDDKFIRVAIAE